MKLGIYRVVWNRSRTEGFYRAKDHSHARAMAARILVEAWSAKFGAVLRELRANRASELDGLFAPADTFVGSIHERVTPSEIAVAIETSRRAREKVLCVACGAHVARGALYPYPGHLYGCGVQRQARLRDEAAYREATKSA